MFLGRDCYASKCRRAPLPENCVRILCALFTRFGKVNKIAMKIKVEKPILIIHFRYMAVVALAHSTPFRPPSQHTRRSSYVNMLEEQLEQYYPWNTAWERDSINLGDVEAGKLRGIHGNLLYKHRCVFFFLLMWHHVNVRLVSDVKSRAIRKQGRATFATPTHWIEKFQSTR